MSTAFGALAPTPMETVSRAVADLRSGLPCMLTDGAKRCVIGAVETLNPERLEALHGLFGTPELVLTDRRAHAVLSVSAAADLASGPVRIRPPEGADAAWFRTHADTATDHRTEKRGPLHLLRGGDVALHRFALQLVKAAELLPAVVLFDLPEGASLPAGVGLCTVEAAAGLKAMNATPALFPSASALFPLQAAQRGRLHVFRDEGGQREHYALEIGTPDLTQPVLARLHSACFTGDVLGSLKCDCGPQLHAALEQMGAEGAGILLYLNQEGRGIGLANKMRVYDLQAQGFDTVEANHQLGFEDDERDFRIAAVMLRSLGVTAVRLLTNNPAKVRVFDAQGITITEQLPLKVGKNIHNSGYLATKARKSGHAL
jgi:GTP cyclohydrolase II